MGKTFTPNEIEKMLTRIYLDMRMGKTYEDKACKEAYILSSMLRAQEIDFKVKRLEALRAKTEKPAS